MKAIVYPPYNKCSKKPLTYTQKAILDLKKERNAVILAHNYVCEDIQEIADYVGDSLGLSRAAKETSADVIVFAGVDFMGETAKILNPEKIVVMPDLKAGCSLEELCDAKELEALKAKHPNAIVISYINCSTDVKILSNIICTSGNALDIVNQIPKDKEIIFCPDKHLGQWVIEQSGRDMILWDGYCECHIKYDAKELLSLKEAFSNAPIIAHPECPKEVRDVSDCVCSTEKMISYCKNSSSDKFIIATIEEMIYRLRKEVPNKIFIAASYPDNASLHCKHMQLNTPEALLLCLDTLSPRIEISPENILAAKKSIDKMLELSF